MKFLVVGCLQGNLDRINELIKETNVDVVLSSGNMGLFYPSMKKLPNPFDYNQLDDYINGKKKFNRPVIAVRGPHDNLQVCESFDCKNTTIENFTLLQNGQTIEIKNNTEDKLPIDKIKIGGVGGSYSPRVYNNDVLIGNDRRHFLKKNIQSIIEKDPHIILMYDLMGKYDPKKIEFDQNTNEMFFSVTSFYCFLGRCNWWGGGHVINTNLVLSPFVEKGYLVFDTKDWNLSSTRFDLVG